MLEKYIQSDNKFLARLDSSGGETPNIKRGMNPLTRDDIRELFTKRQRKELRLPDVDAIDWDNLDFLGWKHPSGHLSYVVYEFEGDFKGIVFEATRQSNKARVMSCSWCITQQPGDAISLYSIQLPDNEKVTIGDYICSDLQCSLYVRNLKQPNIPRLQENLSIEGRIARLQKNVDGFFNRLYHHDE